MLEGINKKIHQIHAANIYHRPVIIPGAEVGCFEYAETRPYQGLKIIPESWFRQGVKLAPTKTQDDVRDMEMMDIVSMGDFPQHFYLGKGLD